MFLAICLKKQADCVYNLRIYIKKIVYWLSFSFRFLGGTHYLFQYFRLASIADFESEDNKTQKGQSIALYSLPLAPF